MSDADRISFWGVDPGFRRISIAAIVPGRFKVRSGEVEEGLPRVETLVRLSEVTLKLARELSEYGQPRSIIVEQPSGKFIKPDLYYAAAAMMLVLADFGFVDTLPPATWKKHALGKGNAKKPEIMEWARTIGYTGKSQDEADALGIARAGQAMTIVMDATPIPADPVVQAELPY
jgi:Holliday junction resolvasome RuvABC endonuclease subunit